LAMLSVVSALGRAVAHLHRLWIFATPNDVAT
jgi:hypothetical protein